DALVLAQRRSVIGGEHDARVVVLLLLTQLVEQSAARPVDVLDLELVAPARLLDVRDVVHPSLELAGDRLRARVLEDQHGGLRGFQEAAGLEARSDVAIRAMALEATDAELGLRLDLEAIDPRLELDLLPPPLRVGRRDRTDLFSTEQDAGRVLRRAVRVVRLAW